MKHYSNQRILKGIAEKDDEVHEYLYNKLLPRIVTYVMNNRGILEDGQDVFQDALIAIHARLKEGPMELNCKFSTYLFQICKNIWLKQLQRKRLFYQSATELREVNATYFELRGEDYMDIEAYLIYKKHVRKLDKLSQDLMHMRNMKIPYKEIAKKLNIPNVAQARKMRYNCRVKLCKMIRKDPAFAELIKKKINDKGRK